MAPGVGSIGGGGNIKGAKIYTNAGMGNSDWSVAAMDWFATAFECNFEPPVVINYSGGGSGIGLTGTDLKSRRLDEKVWNNAQLYVVAAGNDGQGPMPGQGTVNSPGVAKNALTVGSVLDNGYMTVGDLAYNSSRGPTGDYRMKPNVVAPGAGITSTSALVLNSYVPLAGTSFATPHVTGLAATLMHHYPDFKFKPALMRAHLMATALGHDGVPGRNNEYGAGRVSSYLAHWDHNNNDGWFTQRFWGNVNATTAGYREIVVPPNTHRLVVVMTWGEPPASSGASFAHLYDLDLWVDHGADCGLVIPCGEYYSNSGVDGVEYVVVNNPPAGVYALKVRPFDAPTHFLPFAHGGPRRPRRSEADRQHLRDGPDECGRRFHLRREVQLRHRLVRDVRRSRRADHAAERRDPGEPQDDATRRRGHGLPAPGRLHAREPGPDAESLGHVDVPGHLARPQEFHRARVVGKLEDRRGHRHGHRPGGDAAGEPHPDGRGAEWDRRRDDARHQVLRERHGAERRHRAVRARRRRATTCRSTWSRTRATRC